MRLDKLLLSILDIAGIEQLTMVGGKALCVGNHAFCLDQEPFGGGVVFSVDTFDCFAAGLDDNSA
jgi:hypothetical protein